MCCFYDTLVSFDIVLKIGFESMKRWMNRTAINGGEFVRNCKCKVAAYGYGVHFRNEDGAGNSTTFPPGVVHYVCEESFITGGDNHSELGRQVSAAGRGSVRLLTNDQ